MFLLTYDFKRNVESAALLDLLIQLFKCVFCILLEYKVLEMTLKVLLSNKLQKILNVQSLFSKSYCCLNLKTHS